jgi:hypothetical protein
MPVSTICMKYAKQWRMLVKIFYKRKGILFKPNKVDRDQIKITVWMSV